MKTYVSSKTAKLSTNIFNDMIQNAAHDMGISFQTQGQQGNLLLQNPQQQGNRLLQNPQQGNLGFGQVQGLGQINPVIFGFQSGQQITQEMIGRPLDTSDPTSAVIQRDYEKMIKKMSQTDDKIEFIKELKGLDNKDNLFKKHPYGIFILASPQGIAWLEYDPSGKEWLAKDTASNLLFAGDNRFKTILRANAGTHANNIMQNLLTISTEERTKKGEATFMGAAGAADMIQKMQAFEFYKQQQRS